MFCPPSAIRADRVSARYPPGCQFFAVATKVMLRVLVDYQRQRLAARRGGGRKRITLLLDGRPSPTSGPGKATQIEIECLVKGLERLETLDQRQAEVVKMRVVWGLEIKEIAEALGMSPSTVKRDWRFARAWLMDEQSKMEQESSGAGAASP